MTIEPTREALIAAADDAFEAGFGGVIEIRSDGMDAFYVDGRAEKCAIVECAPASPDSIWRSSPSTLLSIFERKRALENAYLSGRLSIGGDMSVMARLALKGR